MVKFIIVNGQFIAQLFTTPDAHTCIDWVPIGRLEDVLKTIRVELTPKGIPYEIHEEVSHG